MPHLKSSLFTDQYQTKPADYCRLGGAHQSGLGCDQGQAGHPQGTPVQGGVHPYHAPSWGPCPWHLAHTLQSDRSGSWGLWTRRVVEKEWRKGERTRMLEKAY